MEERTVNVRLLAVRALHEIYVEGAYANIAVQQYIEKEKLSDQDRRFFTELVYGVLRHHNFLTAVIEHFTKKPIKKTKPWIAMVLRLGMYQILFMDKVPPQAAVNESVKLAKKLARGLAPMANAILRNTVREKDSLTPETLSTNEVERLSIEFNQPQWLIRMWQKDYGKEKAKSLCAYFNKVSTLSARVNTLHGSVEDVLAELTADGVMYTKSKYFPEGVRITKHSGSLKEAPWVKNGAITFMDEGSLGIAHALSPEEGQKVLDMCAAPGSKTMHIATLMHNKGLVKACDVYEHKLTLLEDNAKRLGIDIIQTALQDGTKEHKEDHGQYDRVLVDAPCSGLGILQKKLDMRWRREEKDLDIFPPMQRAILEEGAKALKAGGILVYSTCTLHKKENEDLVETFLKDHGEFTLEAMPDGFPFAEEKEGMVTLLPDRYDTDGFFIARLRKQS